MSALINALKQYIAVPSTEYSGMPHVLIPTKVLEEAVLALGGNLDPLEEPYQLGLPAI
jgi:hypothetical protein